MSDLNVEPTGSQPVDGREGLARKLASIYGIASLVLAILAVSFIGSSTSTTADDYDYTSTLTADDSWDDSWAPYGFTVWSRDSNIAWKWSDNSEFKCDQYDCVEAQFISRDGCPTNFYAAVNWFDARADENGSVVGYDNSSLPALFGMQIARIKFDDINDNGMSAQMAEIDCR